MVFVAHLRLTLERETNNHQRLSEIGQSLILVCSHLNSAFRWSYSRLLGAYPQLQRFLLGAESWRRAFSLELDLLINLIVRYPPLIFARESLLAGSYRCLSGLVRGKAQTWLQLCQVGRLTQLTISYTQAACMGRAILFRGSIQMQKGQFPRGYLPSPLF